MYMVQQRVTTAVRDGYRNADARELEQALAGAGATRAWLRGLHLDDDVRASLDEPVAAVEEALAECLRRCRRSTA